jgi:serine phosphatase RsbU (regulator of sigma subunit)
MANHKAQQFSRNSLNPPLNNPLRTRKMKTPDTTQYSGAGKTAGAAQLKDSDNGLMNFPSVASELTEYEISKSAEAHLLKENLNAAYVSESQNKSSKVESAVNEVFGTLKDYTNEMYDSIRYASQIQKALLPGEHSLRKIMDCFVFNSPKDIVSGDFFWYSVRFNRVILAVADCTGHGVPAALLSIIGNDILNNVVNEKNITEPSEILKHVNLRVHRMFENNINGADAIKDGMDLAVISIDPAANTIDFAGARRPLCGFVNGEFLKIKGDLLSIGIHSPVSAEFRQHRIAYGADDVFYLGSDGFADQFGGPLNKKIGSRQFDQFLSVLRFFRIQEQKKRTEAFFHEWKKHNEQTDDVLFMGIKPGSLSC